MAGLRHVSHGFRAASRALLQLHGLRCPLPHITTTTITTTPTPTPTIPVTTASAVVASIAGALPTIPSLAKGETTRILSRFATRLKEPGAPSLPRGFSCCSAASLPLVRDFIHDSLYNSKYGYFAATPDVVGSIRQPIDFQKLKTRSDYQRLLLSLYSSHNVSWFTPSEIFQPWYGFAIADFICSHRQQDAPLKIFEIGAGNATTAASILEFVRDAGGREVFDGCSYTSIEISASLAERQRSNVERRGADLRQHFDVCNFDAAEEEAWGGPSLEPCFVILLE